MEETMMDNVFQLAFVDLILEVINLFFNLVGNVLLPGILTALFEGLFGTAAV